MNDETVKAFGELGAAAALHLGLDPADVTLSIRVPRDEGAMFYRFEKGESIMVGGRVKEVIILANEVWVNVEDKVRPNESLAVYVERNEKSERIAVGDSLWWQGNRAMWTPSDHSVVDYEMERRGSSGAGRPHGYRSPLPHDEHESDGKAGD